MWERGKYITGEKNIKRFLFVGDCDNTGMKDEDTQSDWEIVEK